MMKKLKLFGALTGILVIVVVILQNTQPVTTRLLFFTVTIPNALTIALALLIGVTAGILLTLTMSGKRETPNEEKPQPGPAAEA
jgi:lipopolysaccharide assembly protein A